MECIIPSIAASFAKNIMHVEKKTSGLHGCHYRTGSFVLLGANHLLMILIRIDNQVIYRESFHWIIRTFFPVHSYLVINRRLISCSLARSLARFSFSHIRSMSEWSSIKAPELDRMTKQEKGSLCNPIKRNRYCSTLFIDVCTRHERIKRERERDSVKERRIWIYWLNLDVERKKRCVIIDGNREFYLS